MNRLNDSRSEKKIYLLFFDLSNINGQIIRIIIFFLVLKNKKLGTDL